MERETIITAFKKALDAWNVHYNVFSPREGSIAISCGFSLKGGIPRAAGVFEFRQAFIRIFAIPLVPLPIPPENLPGMLRLVAMANQNMHVGCFEFEMASLGFRFRYFLDCTGFARIPQHLVRNTLLIPFRMIQRYGDAFVAVANGSSDAATAFAAVKRYLERAHLEYVSAPIPGGHSIYCSGMSTPGKLKTVSQTIDSFSMPLWGLFSFVLFRGAK